MKLRTFIYFYIIKFRKNTNTHLEKNMSSVYKNMCFVFILNIFLNVVFASYFICFGARGIFICFIYRMKKKIYIFSKSKKKCHKNVGRVFKSSFNLSILNIYKA